MMVNIYMKHVKDILQEIGSSIHCFNFVNNNDTYHCGWGNCHHSTNLFINKSRIWKHNSVLKFMHIAYPVKKLHLKLTMKHQEVETFINNTFFSFS